MSTRFLITDNAVNQHASNLDISVSTLASQGSAFLTAIEPLEGVWRGLGFGSWTELTRTWHEHMANLTGALRDIQGNVGDAGQIYDRYHAEQAADLQATTASADWDSAKFGSLA
jgi:uncharacterized protein YukE